MKFGGAHVRSRYPKQHVHITVLDAILVGCQRLLSPLLLVVLDGTAAGRPGLGLVVVTKKRKEEAGRFL